VVAGLGEGAVVGWGQEGETEGVLGERVAVGFVLEAAGLGEEA
jgi:hypothetical protein